VVHHIPPSRPLVGLSRPHTVRFIPIPSRRGLGDPGSRSSEEAPTCRRGAAGDGYRAPATDLAIPALTGATERSPARALSRH